MEQVSRTEGLTYDRVEGIFNHQDELKKSGLGRGRAHRHRRSQSPERAG